MAQNVFHVSYFVAQRDAIDQIFDSLGHADPFDKDTNIIFMMI